MANGAPDWDRLMERLATTGKGPPLTRYVVSQVSQQLSLQLPAPLARLYLEMGNGGFGPHFMPLLTGREHEPGDRLRGETEADWFERRIQATHSVLGFDITQRQPSSEHPWPHGLLTIADYGCGIYFAVDLLDPHLRVIDCEAVEDQDGPAELPSKQGCELAYTHGEVPVEMQQWYVVTSSSLYSWLERWLAHGFKATRWDWQVAAAGRAPHS